MVKSKLFWLNLLVGSVFADPYISYNNYIQNPFGGEATGGGTQIHLQNVNEYSGGGQQVIYESAIMRQNAWEKWFNDGTYNIQAAVSVTSTTNNTTNLAYGSNIFAQTGSAAGFSFGGNLAIINPYFSSDLNGTDPNKYNPFLPANQVIYPNQLFTEFKIPNVFQADAGWLYITTPWVTSSYAEGIQQPTYQGVLLNYQMTRNILWTGMALNGYMPVSATGFSSLTMYNPNYNSITQTPNIQGASSPGTYALGMQYGANTDWNANLWGYQFLNYVNLLYGDSKYTWNLSNNNTFFTLAAQAGIEGADTANNAFAQNGYGTPQSNLVGLQAGFNYDWVGIYASYNNTWGPSTAYQGGGFVSPYTNDYGIDPMYTSSLLSGLVEKSAGQAVKLAPSFTLFSRNLTLTPSYTQYWTSPSPNSNEWDLYAHYTLPEAKGLSFTGFFAYLQQPPQGTIGNATYAEIMTSYVY